MIFHIFLIKIQLFKNLLLKTHFLIAIIKKPFTRSNQTDEK